MFRLFTIANARKLTKAVLYISIATLAVAIAATTLAPSTAFAAVFTPWIITSCLNLFICSFVANFAAHIIKLNSMTPPRTTSRTPREQSNHQEDFGVEMGRFAENQRDEEMAIRLQREFESERNPELNSDEEFARRLEREFALERNPELNSDAEFARRLQEDLNSASEGHEYRMTDKEAQDLGYADAATLEREQREIDAELRARREQLQADAQMAQNLNAVPAAQVPQRTNPNSNPADPFAGITPRLDERLRRISNQQAAHASALSQNGDPAKKSDLNLEYASDKIKTDLDSFYGRLTTEYLKIRNTLSDTTRKTADGLIYPFKSLHVNRQEHLEAFYNASRTTYTWFTVLHKGLDEPYVSKRTSFHVECYKRTSNEPDSPGLIRTNVLIKDCISGIQTQFCEQMTWAMDNNQLKVVLEGITDSVCLNTILTSLITVVAKASENRFKFGDLINTALNHYADVVAKNMNTNKVNHKIPDVNFKNFNDMVAQIAKMPQPAPDVQLLNDDLINFLFEVIVPSQRKNLMPTPNGQDFEANYTKANIRHFLTEYYQFEPTENQKPLVLNRAQLEQGLNDIRAAQAPRSENRRRGLFGMF